MDFQERLQKAIDRGRGRSDVQKAQQRADRLSEEELRQLHSRYRLEVSEHIEDCVKQLPQSFPGFDYEIIYGESGWGAACRRDDVGRGDGGKRANYYSRVELTVRPYSTSLQVFELTGKGTVRNKEIYNRKHFLKLDEVDTQDFIELIDHWVLEFAELYASGK